MHILIEHSDLLRCHTWDFGVFIRVRSIMKHNELDCRNLYTILIFIKFKMKKTSQFAWKKITYCQILNFSFLQGSLKGESVVAAILSSRMEQSYCTSGFFRFPARFLTRSAPILTITHYLRMCFTKYEDAFKN